MRTDHSALTSLLKMLEVVGQQARYLDLLPEYDLEIIPHPEISHQNADALSRRRCEREQDARNVDSVDPRTKTVRIKGNKQSLRLSWEKITC